MFSYGRYVSQNSAKYATQLSNSGGADIGTSLHIDGSASSVADQKNTFGQAIGANARIVSSIQNYTLSTYTALTSLGAGSGTNMHHFQEVIIFDDDMSNNRVDIENNQNAYFNVY